MLAIDRRLLAAMATLYGIAIAGNDGRAPDERVLPNDNRRPAGVRAGGVQRLALEARLGTWHPNGDAAPGVRMAAFAEVGKSASIPGPLLRVRSGTRVRVRVRNALSDTLRVHGLHEHARIVRTALTVAEASSPATPPLVIPPGAYGETEFQLDVPGTFYYWGTTTGRAVNFRTGMDAQLSGAIVVDSAGTPTGVARDRILVLGMWTDTVGRSRVPRARVLAVINGRSWPSTERLAYRTGDTVQWRVINASADAHPMHLHGFYFRVDTRGDTRVDTAFAAGFAPMAVTDNVQPGATMSLTWIPERAGNWLFHCHIPEHFESRGALGVRRPVSSADAHANHAVDGMSGLVMGISVLDRSRTASAATSRETGAYSPRRMRLLVRPSTGSSAAVPLFTYTLHEQGPEPEAPSRYRAAPVMELERARPVQITIVNRLAEPTAVHWHGIELESYYDGVPGFSGAGRRTTPMIAPGDSFVVRFTPPRSGTFIYHTHANEVLQQTAGLAGAILVREPGTVRDTSSDIPLVLAEEPDPVRQGERLLVNGSATPDTLTMRVGSTYRLRLIQMTVSWALVRVDLRRDTTLQQWRIVAKDGASLPPAQRVATPAQLRFGIGEVYDIEIAPDRIGDLRLDLRQGLRFGPPAPLLTSLPIRVLPAR